MARAGRATTPGPARCSIEHALQIGAALAGADEALAGAYSAFGLPLGEALRLRDDVLGVFGDPRATAPGPSGGSRC